MKIKWLLLTLFTVCFLANSSEAQNRENRWMSGIHALFVDYRGPLEKDYFQFNTFDPGVMLSAHTWLAGLLNLSINSALVPAVSYPATDTTFTDGLMIDVNTGLQFKFNNGKILKEDFFFQPFIFVGAGVNIRDTVTSFYVPGGVGFRFRLSKSVSLQLESLYKYTPGKQHSFLSHSAGFIFTLPTKKKEEPIIVSDPNAIVIKRRPGDRDGDGIPDKTDHCPNVPGLVQHNGCPNAPAPETPVVADTASVSEPIVATETPEPPKEDEKSAEALPPEVLPTIPDTPVVIDEPPAELAVEDQQFLDVAMHQVNFLTGSDDLTEESLGTLDQLADLLERYPGYTLDVTGHTDAIGSPRYNLVLSIHRALKVKYYLVNEKGIRLSRIKSGGKGSEAPIADNDTEEGRRLNRRVEFKLSK